MLRSIRRTSVIYNCLLPSRTYDPPTVATACCGGRTTSGRWNVLNCAQQQHVQQSQTKQFISTYPNYYGASKARPKVQYTIEQAVAALREQASGNPNAMVAVSLTMNLDWRIKTQRLAGIFDLPHSSGKFLSVAAATLDMDLAEEALKAGANHAGDIGARILSNAIQWPQHFDIVVCTTEVAHEMTKKTKLGRKLKRHGILPMIESKTIVEPDEFCTTVHKYAYGFYSPYQSCRQGNIATKLGRFSEADENIIENFHSVLRHMYDTQLTQFGNGPDAKKKNIGKYILKIHVTASQCDAYHLDLEQIDICRELNQQTVPLSLKGWRMKKFKK